jgi:hypothetical protein
VRYNLFRAKIICIINNNKIKIDNFLRFSAEEHFGSEVDLQVRGLLNPAESAALPPATLPQQKVSFGPKDATEAGAIKVGPRGQKVTQSNRHRSKIVPS